MVFLQLSVFEQKQENRQKKKKKPVNEENPTQQEKGGVGEGNLESKQVVSADRPVGGSVERKPHPRTVCPSS